ncbi:MAG: hypothetical protein JNK71_02685 [Methyloversatilis sp.]|nr:hypothetical protein [Methyloversatilis sp.]
MENNSEIDRTREASLPTPQETALRRSLLKAGFGVGGVLMARQAKSTFETPYQCTLSGQMSGNVSRNDGTTPNCKIGLSPGYWQQCSRFTTDWKVTAPKICKKVNGSWRVYTRTNPPKFSEITNTELFKVSGTVMVSGSPVECTLGATLASVLGTAVGLTGIPGLADGSSRQVSLWELVAYGEDQTAFPQQIGQFARHIAAGVLNAKAYPGTYPITIPQLRAIWDAITGGGTSTSGEYELMGTGLDFGEIQDYLNTTWN